MIADALRYMGSFGYKLSSLTLDNKIHRFDGKSKLSAWYIGFQNHSVKGGEPYVVVNFGDFNGGDNQTFKPNKIASADSRAIVEQIERNAKRAAEVMATYAALGATNEEVVSVRLSVLAARRLRVVIAAKDNEIALLRAQVADLTRQLAGAVVFHIGGEPHWPIRAERMTQLDGSYLWAVRQGSNALGRNGKWTLEPQPSSRSDRWLAAHRFASYDDALAAYRQSHPLPPEST
jgi:hypothetical protein